MIRVLHNPDKYIRRRLLNCMAYRPMSTGEDTLAYLLLKNYRKKKIKHKIFLRTKLKFIEIKQYNLSYFIHKKPHM